MSTKVQPPLSEAEIFIRLWEGETGRLSAPAARMVLKLGFRDEDKARMHELAAKNSGGTISPVELAEFDSFLKVADLLAILQSKARQVLKRKPVSRGHRG